MKQDNLHIQVCFFRSSVINENNEIDTANTLSEIFEFFIIDSKIDVEKFLENQFAAVCVFDEKYQRVLKVFRTKKRIIKEFFLIECIIIDDLIQYRVERTIINSNIEFSEYR